jgi:ketosteroid isomerase-like protein
VDSLDALNWAFAARDRDAILAAFALHPDVALITSGSVVAQGPEELEGFVDGYVAGDIAYSWEWQSRDEVQLAGDVRLVFAQGTERGVAEDGKEVLRGPYRMTLVLILREGRWRILRLHGSTPRARG